MIDNKITRIRILISNSKYELARLKFKLHEHELEE
jgi:hypothetical protein